MDILLNISLTLHYEKINSMHDARLAFLSYDKEELPKTLVLHSFLSAC